MVPKIKPLLHRSEARITQLVFAMSYFLDDQGNEIRFTADAKYITLLHSDKTGSGTYKPSEWTPGANSIGVKRSRRETDGSLPCGLKMMEE
jgi:hypothetical protein